MIQVEEINCEKDKCLSKRKINFYLVDAHHHIGEDEDGDHKNLNVLNSLGFFRSIWKQLNSEYEKFETSNSYPEYFEPKFKIKRVFPPLPLKFNQEKSRHYNSWVFDQFIAFPFNDSFRANAKKDGKVIQYHSSNTRLSRIVSNSNSGFRLIGYCRLDPNDGELALKELDHSILKLGLKGIKLHPLSDNWNHSEYFSERNNAVFDILKGAIKYNIPIIFDCRYQNTLRWIYKLTDSVYNHFIKNNFNQSYLNSRLKVIIAHIGFLQQENNNFLYKALSHPCIYGDLTGQFSSKTKNLLENLKAKVTCPFENASEFDKKFYWSKKVVMGSDYNYFEAFHIVDQLLYLFSKDFYNLIEGNLSILQNILSNNILRLLPNDLERNKSIKGDIKNLERPLNSYIFSKINFPLFMKGLFKFKDECVSDTKEEKTDYFKIFNDLDYYSLDPDTKSFVRKNFRNQKQNLESQINFYFTFNELNIALIGIIPDKLDRIQTYIINNDQLDSLSFKEIKNAENVLTEYLESFKKKDIFKIINKIKNSGVKNGVESRL